MLDFLSKIYVRLDLLSNHPSHSLVDSAFVDYFSNLKAL